MTLLGQKHPTNKTRSTVTCLNILSGTEKAIIAYTLTKFTTSLPLPVQTTEIYSDRNNCLDFIFLGQSKRLHRLYDAMSQRLYLHRWGKRGAANFEILSRNPPNMEAMLQGLRESAKYHQNGFD
jgi:hypothetical protein